MKKIFSILAVLCLVFGVTATAMAAFQVEVKTNSEPVTGAPGACEKAGNITFIFDQGTIFQDGDWFTADLPIGVTICHSFDFVVLGAPGASHHPPDPAPGAQPLWARHHQNRARPR